MSQHPLRTRTGRHRPNTKRPYDLEGVARLVLLIAFLGIAVFILVARLVAPGAVSQEVTSTVLQALLLMVGYYFVRQKGTLK